jgi:hypothetical protein
MSRKELYDKVRELGLADAINKKYGDNFTRVSNSNLEEAIKTHLTKEKKKEDVTKVATCKGCKEAIIKLISTLQIKRIITAKEAEEIAELLK